MSARRYLHASLPVGMPGKKPDLGITIVLPDKVDCPTAPAIPSTVSPRRLLGPVPGDGVRRCRAAAGTGLDANDDLRRGGRTCVAGPREPLLKAMVALMERPCHISTDAPPWKGTQVSIKRQHRRRRGEVAALIPDALHQIDQSGAVATAIAGADDDRQRRQDAQHPIGVEVYDPVALDGSRARLPRFPSAEVVLARFVADLVRQAGTCATATIRCGRTCITSAPKAAGGGSAQSRGSRRVIDLLATTMRSRANPVFEPPEPGHRRTRSSPRAR